MLKIIFKVKDSSKNLYLGYNDDLGSGDSGPAGEDSDLDLEDIADKVDMTDKAGFGDVTDCPTPSVRSIFSKFFLASFFSRNLLNRPCDFFVVNKVQIKDAYYLKRHQLF